jgi:hypothetical protein
LFSNTLSLCSSLNIRDQVSHPYRTAGKIVLYILIFMVLEMTGKVTEKRCFTSAQLVRNRKQGEEQAPCATECLATTKIGKLISSCVSIFRDGTKDPKVNVGQYRQLRVSKPLLWYDEVGEKG